MKITCFVAAIIGLLASLPAHAQTNGVFNVRVAYGAVPDGSTDNSTAITNAFTASNAFTTGQPTIFFDCNTGTTTCQYNYGGSGTSPVNPTIPTSIVCAPGVILNYTGSAHALDIGASGRVTTDYGPYNIYGCQFTGGSNYTHGIYINNLIVSARIINNSFVSFGNLTGFEIYFASNNFEGLVQGNTWWGTSFNILDAHNTADNAIVIIDNKVECSTPGGCAQGVGFWVGFTAIISHNIIQFHTPNIRISSVSAGGAPNGVTISENYFEVATNSTAPSISYGDPAGTAGGVTCGRIEGNYFAGSFSATSVIDEETPSAGHYTLNNCVIARNNFATVVPSAKAVVNTGPGINNFFDKNYANGTALTVSSTVPAMSDRNSTQYFGVAASQGSATNPALTSGLAAFVTGSGSLPGNLMIGNFHTVAMPRVCIDVSGSGTTQSCSTTPLVTWDDLNITPTAGDEIIYKTSTTNTGDLTITIQGTTTHVRKFGGAQTLAPGDIKSGIYYALVYDGTYWEMSNNNLGFNTVTKTANYTVLSTDNGNRFDNTGAAGEVDFSLPVAAAGLNYCFVVYSAQTLKIIGNGTDQIAIGASNSSSENITASATFSSICLEAHGTGQWIASNQPTGTWTVH